jgi:hypothetical protein
MGGSCNTHDMRKAYKKLWPGNLNGGDHLEVVGADVGIILKWILREIRFEVGCIHVAEDSDQWRFLLSTVMNFRVP